jgi:hypothetical protein
VTLFGREGDQLFAGWSAMDSQFRRAIRPELPDYAESRAGTVTNSSGEGQETMTG